MHNSLYIKCNVQLELFYFGNKLFQKILIRNYLDVGSVNY